MPLPIQAHNAQLGWGCIGVVNMDSSGNACISTDCFCSKVSQDTDATGPTAEPWPLEQ